MTTSYHYSLANDFPGGLNSSQLYTLINNSAIVPSLLAINTNDDDVEIQFNSSLSEPEVTILNDIIANYVYSEGPPPPATPICKFRSNYANSINGASPTTISWDIQDILDETKFAQLDTNTIKVIEDGYYKIDCLTSFQTSETGEFNTKMNVVINGVNSPVAARLAYFKNVNPNVRQSGNYISDILMLSADDQITIAITGIGDSGDVNLIAGQSSLCLQKLLLEYTPQ